MRLLSVCCLVVSLACSLGAGQWKYEAEACRYLPAPDGRKAGPYMQQPGQLWTMNQDGTQHQIFQGNTYPYGVYLDAKPIPGTHDVVFSDSPGILPESFDLAHDPVDPYALDRRYWALDWTQLK